MLLRVTKLGVALIVLVVAGAWFVKFVLAPANLYSTSSTARSQDGSRLLTVGTLNPYPLSRECYRYIYIHPAEVLLDTRKVQWDYVVAYFSCDGEVAGSWVSPTQVQISASRTKGGSLPHAFMSKTSDTSGSVRVLYARGA